ncbi:MAG: NAD(P)-dependent oxidoreductase [Acidimicrobiia bacterium]|nr:NAD(P)-dependent oxidoreductase [Acidimicrobiia bacterium]
MRIGVLHPGKMGSTVAASFAETGHEVSWASEGRSEATAGRASGLVDGGSLADVCAASELIVSVCPPHAALDVARAVASTGFDGTFIDANAVAPATTLQVREVVTGPMVDGSLIGPPAHQAGTTHLYLSGDGANDLAEALNGGLLEVRAIDGPVGAASALKMAYGGWSKASAGLLLALIAYAEASGVRDDLFAEWDESIPGTTDRAERTARGSGPKAWRFAGEMREVAAALDAEGLPDGFHLGAAEVFERLAGFKDAEPGPELEAALRALLD